MKVIECQFPKEFDVNNITFEFFDGKQFSTIDSMEHKDNNYKLYVSTNDSVSILKLSVAITLADSSINSVSSFFYTSAKLSKIAFKSFDKKVAYSILYQDIDYESINDSRQIDTKAFLGYKSLNDSLNIIYANLQNGISEDSLDFYNKKINYFRKKILVSKLDFAKSNSTDFGTLFLFNGMADYEMCINDSAVLSTFQFAMNRFKEIPFYKFIHEKILRSECLDFGTLPDSLVAPDNSVGKIRSIFTATKVNGEFYDLEETVGKKVILNFWATWCGPCINEIPELIKFKKIHPEYTIIGISWDEDPEITKKTIQKLGIDWTVVMMDKKILKTYSIQAIPKNIFIDEKGKIFAVRTQRLSLLTLLEIVEKND